jgi:hypothetical protein
MAAQDQGNTLVEQSGYDFSRQKAFNADFAIPGKVGSMGRNEVLAETAALATGVVVYSFFTARQSIRGANTMAFFTGGTAAATVTTIKYGLYEVASNGDLTLLAKTANDATLLTAADTAYPKVFESSGTVDVKAGKRYASAVIFVGTTAPTLLGRAPFAAAINVVAGAINQEAPKRSAQNASETDLVATVLVADQAASEALIYSQVYKV